MSIADLVKARVKPHHYAKCWSTKAATPPFENFLAALVERLSAILPPSHTGLRIKLSSSTPNRVSVNGSFRVDESNPTIHGELVWVPKRAFFRGTLYTDGWPPPEPPPEKFQWDFFIAHSSADEKAANDLYDLLTQTSRVFLDTRSLHLGDDWDVEIAGAQQCSLVTIVLISSNTARAYYQREEIAAAIALARASDERRVVPIYLDGEVATSDSVPYGLRLKHGMSLSEDVRLDNVADALIKLRRHLRSIAGEPTADVSIERSTSVDKWKVVVFNFANWGETVEKDYIGQRYSGVILNYLLDLHLNSQRMSEEPQYLPVRGSIGENFDLGAYKNLIPFVAVVGFVAPEEGNSIGATVRVISVCNAGEIEALIVHEDSFRNSVSEMRKSAQHIAEKIRAAIELHLDIGTITRAF